MYKIALVQISFPDVVISRFANNVLDFNLLLFQAENIQNIENKLFVSHKHKWLRVE